MCSDNVCFVLLILALAPQKCSVFAKKKNRKSEERCCSGPGKNEPFSKENIKTCEWSLVARNSASSLHSTVCWLRKPSDITVQLKSTQKILNKFTRGFIIILINFNHKKNIYVKSNIFNLICFSLNVLLRSLIYFISWNYKFSYHNHGVSQILKIISWK